MRCRNAARRLLAGILTGGIIKKAIVDRGYKIKEQLGSIEIVMPIPNKKESYYKKKQREARCRSRAGIEGLISHLKHDNRMLRNYLKGTVETKSTQYWLLQHTI